MAFKKICKIMKRRTNYMKIAAKSRKESSLKVEVRRSTSQLIAASQGREVLNIWPSERNPNTLSPSKSKVNIIEHEGSSFRNKTKNIRRLVSKHLESFQAKQRLGKGSIVVEQLERNLNMLQDLSINSPLARKLTRKLTVSTKRKSTTVALSGNKTAALIKAVSDSQINSISVAIQKSFLKGSRPSTPAPITVIEDEANENVDDDVEYLSGTSIYFGATVALQARHGGFLSYNNGSQIKASAHKKHANTRFIVKNSEDLTDIGIMKYGDALWLQAGNHDVLGAQYGTLVDQKRTIQPALVSCKRASMFKAQQYGRWIVLNRVDPMGTLGQPVLHDDRVMLEQEWYFLASISPYQSSMYKTLNNSDEAMTTKVDLFQPGEECSWKMHLVALPSDDKASERQRQLLLQVAKENMDRSEEIRYAKTPGLLSSLQSGLPGHLHFESMLVHKLRHKCSIDANQMHLMNMYKDMSRRDFRSKYGAALYAGSRVCGTISTTAHRKQIAQQQAQQRYNLRSDVLDSNSNGGRMEEDRGRILEEEEQRQQDEEVREEAVPAYRAKKCNTNNKKKQIGYSTSSGYKYYNCNSNYNASNSNNENIAETMSSLDIADDHYWGAAQQVLVNTRSWVELPTAMSEFKRIDLRKKLSAVLILQKWMRKTIDANFKYERAMKKVDLAARLKLEEKQIARTKVLVEHRSAIEMISASSNNNNNNANTPGSSTAPLAMSNNMLINSTTASAAPMSSAYNNSYSNMNNIIAGNVGNSSNTNNSSVMHHHYHPGSLKRSSSHGTGMKSTTNNNSSNNNNNSISNLQRQLTTPLFILPLNNGASDDNTTTIDNCNNNNKSRNSKLPLNLHPNNMNETTITSITDRNRIFTNTEVVTIANTIDNGSNFKEHNNNNKSRDDNNDIPNLLAAADSVPTSESGSNNKNNNNNLNNRSFSLSSSCSIVNFVNSNSNNNVIDNINNKNDVSNNPKNSVVISNSDNSIVNNSSNNINAVINSLEVGDNREQIIDLALQNIHRNDSSSSRNNSNTVNKTHNYETLITVLRNSGNSNDNNNIGIATSQPPPPQLRPSTANAALHPIRASATAEQQRQHQLTRRKQHQERQLQRDRIRLGQSSQLEYGLPLDVFQDTVFHDDVNMKIGLKFLRAMSANPSLYEDVEARKRSLQQQPHHPSRHHHHHPKPQTQVRPVTASTNYRASLY